MAFISIIIPVYNVAAYITECLNSVNDQTYAQLGRIECILVDDCGLDNSVQIANEIIDSYKGPIEYRIVRHRINKGLSAARNTGLKAARGEWVFFLDSDDWIQPDCLESLVKSQYKYPQSEIVISSMESDNDWVAQEALVGREDIPEYTEDRLWIMKGLLSRPVLFPLSAWNKLYKKEFLIENNLFFLEGFIREDEIWSFDYSKYVKCVAFNKKNTYHYRVNPNGIVSTSKQYVSQEFSLQIIEYYLNNVTDFGKEIQLKLISQMLLKAYIYLHNDVYYLQKCQNLFKSLGSVSNIKRRIGCYLFRYLSHKLVCKRYIFECVKFLF